MIRTAICAVALLKLLLAALTLGTNDMAFFRHFGWEILQHGLAHEYRHDPLFNHTPFVGGFTVVLSLLSCGSERVFAFLLRAPGVLADAAVALALARRGSGWLAAAFAASPTAFMVSGFHGNVDSLLAASLFFAAQERDARRCGLWLALACNVKVAALFVAPVFFFHHLARGEARRFFLPAAGVILLGWSPALLACPLDFLRQSLGYSGYWGIWGFTWLLKATGLPEFQVIGADHLPASEVLVMNVLKLLLIAACLAIAWLRRRGDLWLTLALVWAVFMSAASGVAAQYLVWPLAAVFVVSPRCWALVEAGNGIFLLVFYTTLCGGLPWYFGEANAVVNERWLPWSGVAWIAWIVCLAALLRRWTRTPCLSHAPG